MPVLIAAFAATAAAAPELSAAAIAAIAAVAASSTAATTGGIYYYRQEIYRWLNQLLNRSKKSQDTTLAELAIELKLKQQQPLACANALHENLLARHDALLSQSTEQQESLSMSLMELGTSTDKTTTLVTTLTNLAPSLHLLADEAKLDAQAMHHATTDLCEQMARSNHNLQTTQYHLMETEEQFSALLDGLTATENTFAQSLGMKEKIHQLSDLQQQTSSPPNPNQLITENILLRQQIRDLQAKAEDTRKLLIELSEENHELRKLIPTHEPQRNTPSMTLFGSK